MKTYKQYMSELIRSVGDMKHLDYDGIMKGMDIIDKTSRNKKDKEIRRLNFLKDLGVSWHSIRSSYKVARVNKTC